MFARVITMQLKSDKLDDAAKFYKENIVPAVKYQKGFNSNYLLIDRETGKAISVALWNSKEDIIANEESGWWKGQINSFEVFLDGPFTREIYEVVAQS
ncbi:MAG: antibiotic biosynthesis monooxygenase family protein [Candidatus Hermodarchaeia archaeon]|jgi:heme-degrading monooxygenase HmoA